VPPGSGLSVCSSTMPVFILGDCGFPCISPPSPCPIC
jgi:hypothetical protein